MIGLSFGGYVAASIAAAAAVVGNAAYSRGEDCFLLFINDVLIFSCRSRAILSCGCLSGHIKGLYANSSKSWSYVCNFM